VKESYAWGVNQQDITSLGISGLHNLTATQIADRVTNLEFRSAVWGIPYGLFYHNDELTTIEAVSAKDIVDDANFKSGLEEIINGTVKCLNASIWAKQK
jgi:hypothetical protein